MPAVLTDEIVETLSGALCGQYLMEADGITFFYRPISGDAVAMAIRTDDEQLVLVIDLDKPNAIRHARTMLREEGWLLFDDVEPGQELPIVDRNHRLRILEPNRAARDLPPPAVRTTWRPLRPRHSLESVRVVSS